MLNFTGKGATNLKKRGSINYHKINKSKLLFTKPVVATHDNNDSSTIEKKIESKEDFRKVCNNNLQLIRKIIIPNIPKECFYEAFYIEFRVFNHAEYLIRNTLIKLPKWAHTVVCGNNNYKSIKNICNKISPNIKIIKLDIDNLNTAEYSRLLMTKEFWENFKGEKLLLYQEDSYLFHNKIKPFLQYDYIGAPWPEDQDEHINQKEYGVGNGGFSLRTKSKMIECIENIDWEKDLELGPRLKEYMKNTNNYVIPEDVYFSKSLLEKNIGSVAPRRRAINFSQETQSSINPLGGHNFFLAKNKLSLDYLNLKLCNTNYYKQVSHRGGWNTVINYGIYNCIIDNRINLNKINLIDCCESYFLWDNNIASDKWIGILHLTNKVPQHQNNIDIDNLFYRKNFADSLKHCKGLIVLSQTMKNYLDNFKKQYNLLRDINIYCLKHPTITNILNFNLKKFFENDKYNLILLGQQLRKVTDIFLINNQLINNKIWLSGSNILKKNNNMLFEDLLYNNMLSDDKTFIFYKDKIQFKYYKDFRKYDNDVITSIIIIPLYNASANNSILEIMASNTPAFITRLPATEEYLGPNYPMFYSHVDEINTILSDKNLFKKKYTDTHNYLKNMDKSDLTYERFYSDLLKIINNVY